MKNRKYLLSFLLLFLIGCGNSPLGHFLRRVKDENIRKQLKEIVLTQRSNIEQEI